MSLHGPDVRWLEPGEAPADLDRPAVWLVAPGESRAAALAAAVRPGPSDLEDAALFASDARADARLQRRRLLRALAGAALGARPEDVHISRSQAGALAITAPRALCVSHSAHAGWTMVGLCAHPLGVDVERAAPEPPLPLDLLGPDEAMRIAAMPDADQPLAFARAWTVKEAVLKALGRGLMLDPAGLDARFVGASAEVFADGAQAALAVAETLRQGPVMAAVAVLA